MTDNTIPLPDAIRAYKDRPSMELELSALRAKCERLEGAAIEGNAATRQDVVIQIGRMVSQALNERGD